MSNNDHNDEYIAAFIEKAKELMPHQDELHTIDQNDILTDFIGPCEIGDYFFSKSEYLGGMAAVICAVLDQEGE